MVVKNHVRLADEPLSFFNCIRNHCHWSDAWCPGRVLLDEKEIQAKYCIDRHPGSCNTFVRRNNIFWYLDLYASVFNALMW